MKAPPSITSTILLDCTKPALPEDPMLQSLISILQDAPAFAAQYACVASDWVLEGDSHGRLDAPYEIDAETGTATMDVTRPDAEVALNLAACLRDIGHVMNEQDEPTHPEALIHIERIREADIAAFTLKVAWQMREVVEYDLWRQLLAGPMGDMAMMFQNVAGLDPHLEDALEAAFIHWYSDTERVTRTDRDTLNLMDMMMEEETGLLSLHATRHISRTRQVAMGCQPDTGLTYLSRVVHQLQADPYFAGMEDDVNQTYLLHIMRDLQTTRVHDVAFRDDTLARRLFPHGEVMAYS